MPAFKSEIVDSHQQLFDWSCIPSAVELVLKLTGQVSTNYYDLQEDWQNNMGGTFANFDGLDLYGLQFSHKFKAKRDDSFPLTDLFDTISNELTEQRYVIVSLPCSGVFHTAIIYDNVQDNEFIAFTKLGKGLTCSTAQLIEVWSAIVDIKGTDILVYK
ncbi:MAG: hypothetical protein FD174_3659 [Geobacteraceae bacterium]|nr:MAG: hypothetical protein FD174_3659 [Geobacteraceae bacterium]